MRRLIPVLILLQLALAPGPAAAQTIVRAAGNVTVQVDPRLAYPGGLFVVYVSSRRPLSAYLTAVFDGRRLPMFWTRRGYRALVPVAATLAAGDHTLGVEIRTGRGRRRIPVPVTVAPREYPARTTEIPEPKRALLVQPGVVRDGRQVQLLLRTVTPVQQWTGPFKPPVDSAPEYSYGAPTVYLGSSPVESLTDAVWGEYHRGMDYPVAPGTLVQAPAAGTVLLARQSPLTGGTLLLDHGQGVISAFFHLERIELVLGQSVVGRTPIGIAGETGIAGATHVHWGLYVQGVAIDPRIMESLVDP